MRHGAKAIPDVTRRIHRVLDHIHAHLDSDLSLDELADVAALSRFHFHRVYRGAMNETVAQTVRRYRLHRAAADLVRTDRPLEEIAARTGFARMDSFVRSFSQHFGKTPLAYRKRGAVRLPVDPTPDQTETPMPDIEIRDMPALRLAAMAHHGPYPEMGHAYEKLSAIMGPAGLWPEVKGAIGVFFDDPGQVPAADLRSLAGYVLPEGIDIPAPATEHIIPAAPTAVYLHKGPYSDLPASYDLVYGKWLPGSGRTPGAHASWENYLNSPMDTAPDDLLTEICVPLAP